MGKSKARSSRLKAKKSFGKNVFFTTQNDGKNVYLL